MQLEQLRQKIARIERRNITFKPSNNGHKGVADRGWQSGCAAIDDVLPQGRLAYDALHDFSTFRSRDTPAMDHFVLALLQRFLQTKEAGEIIWCQSHLNMREHGHPYGPGLKALGLAPERLLFVSLRKEHDLAFAMEESLRSGAVAAVIGEGAPIGFTASRRLSIACQEMAIPCLFLNNTNTYEASAAATRWRIAPAIGPPNAADLDGPGMAAWSVSLLRARGGCAHPGNPPSTVFWNDATYSFNLVSAAGNRALADRAQTRPTVRSAYPAGRIGKAV